MASYTYHDGKKMWCFEGVQFCDFSASSAARRKGHARRGIALPPTLLKEHKLGRKYGE